MAPTKLIFQADEVQRLRTKIGQVSQDTNRLYLQLRGQANSWGSIPLGQNLVNAQVLINELTVEAEKLEDFLRTTIQGVQNAQNENKRQASQWGQQLSLFAGMFKSFGADASQGRLTIPTVAQKAATHLISAIAILAGRDTLNRDPMVKKLREMIQKSGIGTVDSLTAQSKLKEIYEARDLIAKAQTAYKVYEAFGNRAQMEAVHKQAEDARRKLESLGVEAVQYQAGKDLSAYFKQPAVKACDYDPSITTSSVPLMEKEEYAFLLRMAVVEGPKGNWAKQQLELMKPQATIGPVDPYNAVSEADILNRDDPQVIERLKGTYWFKLSAEEQDRRFEEVKAYYEQQGKEAAAKNRLAESGVGNQTLANILVGGSNMVVNAIDTASYGMAGTVTDWVMGPKPEGYVDPLDDPYGKRAGQTVGNFVSIGLPWKYLKGVPTPGLVGKFSPTLFKSMVAGAVSGTVGEAFDAFNDYRDDGKQSFGERITTVGINTAFAAGGDALITAGSKWAAGAVKFVSGKLPNSKVEKVEVAGKANKEIEIKAKGIEEARVEGTGKGPIVPDELRPIDPETGKIIYHDWVSAKPVDLESDKYLIDKVAEARSGLSNKYKDKGNFAYAKADIDGLDQSEFFAHSKITDPNKKIPGAEDFSLDPENPSFPATKAALNEGKGEVILRDMDTEYKILNDIDKKLNHNKEAKGTIVLFTEKDTCGSCNLVISKFKEYYPDITIKIIHNNGNLIDP